MLIEDNNPELALGWNNIVLFTFELLDKVLKSIGFVHVELSKYRQSSMPEFNATDNRPDKGSSFIEAFK
jgi:hypothetical protein